MMEPESEEGTRRAAVTARPEALRGHPVAARYATQTIMAMALMASPTMKVLRMYPHAISVGDMGVTRTSLILPVDLSSTIV